MRSIILLLLLSLCVSAQEQQAPQAISSSLQQGKNQKFAVVISMDSSKYLDPLPNAYYDGIDVSTIFNNLTYTTLYLRNVRVPEIEHKLDSIAEFITDNTQVVIYITTHGLGINNEPFMLAWDANISSARWLKHTSISIYSIINRLSKKSKLANIIVFLDACRLEVPSRIRKKFSMLIKTDPIISDNFFINFACGANKSAFGNRRRRNSYYSEGFIKYAKDSVSLNVLSNEIGNYVRDCTHDLQKPAIMASSGVDFRLGGYHKQERSMVAEKDSLPGKGYHSYLHVSKAILHIPARDFSYSVSYDSYSARSFIINKIQSRHLPIFAGLKKKTKPFIQKITCHEQNPVVPVSKYFACTGSHLSKNPEQEKNSTRSRSSSVSKTDSVKYTCE